MEEVPKEHKGKSTRPVSIHTNKTQWVLAVIYSKPGTLETQVIDVETPTPAWGEILIRL